MNTSTNHEILRQHFGYTTFRGEQEQIIQHVQQGKDCLVLMPTGGGKSICYQVPALSLEGTTLVISPLIALMKDQVDSLRSNGISAAYLNSSMAYEEEERVVQKVLAGNVKLLYMSPEKALATLNGFLSRVRISLIAIDEAHCISSWGHDFRPEYKELSRLRAHFNDVAVMALTATADKLTRLDILELLGLRDPGLFIASFDRPNLSLCVKPGLNSREKLNDMLDFLAQHRDQQGIIYCTARKTTEIVAHQLKQNGILAAAYHAGLTPQDRQSVQEDFIHDRINVVCATIAFGMGIDKSNVRFVFHYNLPRSIEGYYQEIGRGGRDGLPCDTVLYYTLGDMMMMRSFAEQSGQPEINLEKLKRVMEFAEAKHCRRRILLSYFGQTTTENCGNCDVCRHPPTTRDGSVVAQKALSALVRMKQKGVEAGAHLLIDVLRGMKNENVLRHEFQKLKTYGTGSDLTVTTWQFYIMQMIQLGAMEIAYDQGNVLRMTAFGEGILHGKYKLYLNDPIEFGQSTGRRSRPGAARSRFSIVQEPEGDADTFLFNRLRILRKKIADDSGMAPYLILHDSSLRDMVARKPRNEAEMLEVAGISQAKFYRFGHEFLRLFLEDGDDAHGATSRQATIDSALNPDRLLAYKDELLGKGLRFSSAIVAGVLCGSALVTYSRIGAQVSFYNILGGIEIPQNVQSRIKSFYKPFEAEQKQKKEERKLDENARLEAARLWFDSSRNFLTSTDIDAMRHQVNAAPLQKSGETLNHVRALNPRAMEPWSVEETGLLRKAISGCNDLALLTGIFGRSEKSIVAKCIDWIGCEMDNGGQLKEQAVS
jgi:ATP-dependent DNA helicase RecQ